METEEAQQAAEPRAGGFFREPWLLGAGLCVLTAAACLVLGYYDAAFVTGALGAVAWFLNYRAKLPPLPDEEDEEDLSEDSEEGAAGGDVRRD